MKGAKKIKVRNRDVYDAMTALTDLVSQKLKPELSHRLALSLRGFKTEHETLEETRERLLDRWAETDEKGQRIEGGLNPITKLPTWKMKNREAFNREWQEILKAELESEITIYPIKLSEFGKKFEIAAFDLEVLLTVGVIEPDPEPEEDDREE